MGHLVNPNTLRLSYNSFWNSNWSLINTFNYVNIFKKDYLLFSFLNWFTKKSKFLKFNILMSHYKIYRINNLVYLNIYYYKDNLQPSNYNNYNDFIKDIFQNNEKLSKNFELLQEFILKKIIFNLYWRVLNQSLLFFFNKLEINNKFYLNIYNLDSLNISAQAITTYLSLKLQKRYSLDWVLRPILKDLGSKIKRRSITGYKIVCSGRFTRKQIATYMWMKGGSINLNTISNLIKYSEARIRLKYGLCGIKVWINYKTNSSNLLTRNFFLIYPFYIPLKYNISLRNKNITFYTNSWFYLYIRCIFFKSKDYSFYSDYLKIKIKMILNNLLELNNKKYYLSKYKINLLNNNQFVISFEDKQINFLALYKKELNSNYE